MFFFPVPSEWLKHHDPKILGQYSCQLSVREHCLQQVPAALDDGYNTEYWFDDDDDEEDDEDDDDDGDGDDADDDI